MSFSCPASVNHPNLTGSTVTKIVASSATINDIKLKLIMINSSFFCGFHSCIVSTSAFDSTSESDFVSNSNFVSKFDTVSKLDSAYVSQSMLDFDIVSTYGQCILNGVVELRMVNMFSTIIRGEYHVVYHTSVARVVDLRTMNHNQIMGVSHLQKEPE